MPKKAREKIKKPRIAVIGAGINGVIAASALPHDIVDVDVFEQRDEVGGNVRTLEIEVDVQKEDGTWETKTICIDAGAEYIAIEDVYPLIHRGHAIVGKEDELSTFSLSIHLDNLDAKKDIVLPPVVATSNGEDDNSAASSSCLPLLSLFGASKKQPILKFSLIEFIKDLSAFIDFDALIKRAKGAQYSGNEASPTLEEFVNAWAKKNEEKLRFADEFLYPLIAGGWGVSIENIKKDKAHFAFAYLTAGNIWYEAAKGFQSYIKAFKQRYEDKVNYQFNTEISKIEAVEIDGATKYKLLTKEGVIVDEKGKPRLYDQIITATPAFITKDLLADIDEPSVQELVEAYKQVQCFPMDVVIHTDNRPIFVSSEGAMVKTNCEGGLSLMTMLKAWKYKGLMHEFYKSWVPPELASDDQRRPDPEKVIETFSYTHYRMGVEFERAYEITQKRQGSAGIYSAMPDSDSQNASIAAGLSVAEQVCALYNQPKTTLLEQFDYTKPLIPEALPSFACKKRALQPNTEVIETVKASTGNFALATACLAEGAAALKEIGCHPNKRLLTRFCGDGIGNTIPRKGHKKRLDKLFTSTEPVAAPSNVVEEEHSTLTPSKN